jgi:hypothetical protein
MRPVKLIEVLTVWQSILLKMDVVCGATFAVNFTENQWDILNVAQSKIRRVSSKLYLRGLLYELLTFIIGRGRHR